LNDLGFSCSSLMLMVFLNTFCFPLTPRTWMETCWTPGKEFGCSACGVWMTAGPSLHPTPTNAFEDTTLRTWLTETCKSPPWLGGGTPHPLFLLFVDVCTQCASKAIRGWSYKAVLVNLLGLSTQKANQTWHWFSWPAHEKIVTYHMCRKKAQCRVLQKTNKHRLHNSTKLEWINNLVPARDVNNESVGIQIKRFKIYQSILPKLRVVWCYCCRKCCVDFL